MTTSAMKLVLRPGHGGVVRMSLTAKLQDVSAQHRRSLMEFTSLWAQPELLRVAVSADESGSWAWAESWTEALADVTGGYELRFAERRIARGHR
jgi:hypothetical protein